MLRMAVGDLSRNMVTGGRDGVIPPYDPWRTGGHIARFFHYSVVESFRI